MKKQVPLFLFLFYFLVTMIGSGSSITEKGNRAIDDSALYRQKKIHLAAFFPTTSFFSKSITKNRMNQQKLFKKIQINNQNSYQQFIKKSEKLITLLNEMDKGPHQYHEVLIYWQLGEQIEREMALHNNKSYHLFLLNSLSTDLGMSQKKLNAIIALKEVYPIAAVLPLTLSWAHCEILVRIEDKEKRIFYQNIAVKNQWEPDELFENIQKNIYEKTD
jgi:hypothetical protein